MAPELLAINWLSTCHCYEKYLNLHIIPHPHPPTLDMGNISTLHLVSLGHCNIRLQCVPMLSSAHGYREQLGLFLLSSNFQSWGQAQKRKMAIMFNKVIGLLGKWCHHSKWHWLYPFINNHWSLVHRRGLYLGTKRHFLATRTLDAAATAVQSQSSSIAMLSPAWVSQNLYQNLTLCLSNIPW